MKKMIAITLTVFTLFACILPASAAQTPTVEPLYDNATIASVSLSIDSSGKATVKITLQGKSTLKSTSVTTYLEKKVGTQWVRVDIDAAGDAWQYSTTSRAFQKIYSTTLSSSGQYRAVATFTLTGSTTETVTVNDTATY